MTATEDASLTVRFVRSMEQVKAPAWDALVGDDYPFLRHAFLHALEASGCVSAETGWQPLHLLIEREGRLLACMPLYAKTHSMGEYVFDWSWADAYARHGLDYYPKLLSAIPFTPCAGPRLCIAPGEDLRHMLALAEREVRRLAGTLGASSWHLLFPDEALRASLAESGMLLRSGVQYQWFNDDYRDFDHFLEFCSSRKRKNLRKERARVAAENITFEALEGAAITPLHWQRFYLFYQSTYFVRGRAPYLSEDFFLRLGQTLPERLVLVLARKDGAYIAGALFFKGADTLYGRYWGCTEEYQFLHFETCYYQGIDYCIRQGLRRFDSGAQGEHKIQRGFRPVTTWSAHWIAQPQFAHAIAEFVREEARHVAQYSSRATECLPFRRDLDLPASRQ